MREFVHFRYQSLSELITRYEVCDFIRDVGVAGSNPVTPTTCSWVHSGYMGDGLYRRHG